MQPIDHHHDPFAVGTLLVSSRKSLRENPGGNKAKEIVKWKER
jgi:hypothetical protein